MELSYVFYAFIVYFFVKGLSKEKQLHSLFMGDIKEHKKVIITGSTTLLNLANIKAKDGLTILTSLPDYIKQAPSPSKFRYLTTVLTSIGVLGTFVGIVIGLEDVATKIDGRHALPYNA